ncbi:hypothetical protein Tco_1036806 [Tanacetum coccineum]
MPLKMRNSESEILYILMFPDLMNNFGGSNDVLLERISKKRTKNKAKIDKTGLGMEKQEKDKVKVQAQVNPKAKSQEK